MSEVLSLPAQFQAATTEVHALGAALLRQNNLVDDLDIAFSLPSSTDRASETQMQLDETEAALLQQLDQQTADSLTYGKRLQTAVGSNGQIAHYFGSVEGFSLDDTHAVMPGTIGLARVEHNDAHYILSHERDAFKTLIVPRVGRLLMAPLGMERTYPDGVSPQIMGKYLGGYVAPVVTEKLRDVVIPMLRDQLKVSTR